uniref:Uncharacterized protein n=1 Tax=mine drainage metagenome TaxID=410659 RepID=E6PY15_9ZZZZ
MATFPSTPETKKSDRQLLKIREMRDILEFDFTSGSDGTDLLRPLKTAPGFEKESYRANDLRREIEPWLTALFQSEHLSLLVGAGLTTAVHYHVTGKLPGGFSCRDYATFNTQIKAEAIRSAKEMGRGEANPEDQLRTALRIVDGLRILVKGSSESEPWKSIAKDLATLENDISTAIEALISGILGAERGVISQEERREEALVMLVSFLMSFASRTGTSVVLHY